MNPPFNAHQLRSSLSELPVRSALAFGLLILERALPGYYKFLSDNDLRDRDRLRELSAGIWRFLEIGHLPDLPSPDWDGVIESEDYSSIYTTSAVDAVSISYELRDFVRDNDIDHIVSCASLRVDTVDIYVQNSGTASSVISELNELILNHSIMQMELNFQRLDFLAIGASEAISNAWRAALQRTIEGRYSELKLIS